MIRVFVCIKKLPHLSDEQFHAHWRHPHGTLTRRLKQLRGYVQSHGIGTQPALPGLAATPYLGVPMIWLDSLQELAAMSADPDFKPLQEDALLLYEQQDVVWMIMREPAPGDTLGGEWERRDCVNALVLVRRAAPCEAVAFEARLREWHAAVRAELAGRAQCRLSLPEADAYREAPCAYDALVEFRCADPAAFNRLWNGETVRSALARLFAGIADQAASRSFLGQEERFI